MGYGCKHGIRDMGYGYGIQDMGLEYGYGLWSWVMHTGISHIYVPYRHTPRPISYSPYPHPHPIWEMGLGILIWHMGIRYGKRDIGYGYGNDRIWEY